MGTDRGSLAESIRLRGEITVRVFGPDGRLRDERAKQNQICTAGLTDLMFFLALIGDPIQGPNYQNNPLATPYASTWGAIGGTINTPSSPIPTPEPTDTELDAEIARANIGPNASDSDSWTWEFYYGTTGSDTWYINEAGVFLNGVSTAGTGALLNHGAIVPQVVKAGDATAVMQTTFTVVY